jgi:ornithine cyclodeaminase
VLRRAAVFVEYEPQTRVEGDLQQMPADFAVTELWRVLALQAAGRTSVEQVTVFDSVGFALEDHSALHFLHDAARRLHIGNRIDLVPRTRDPKDLFATISRAPQPLAG